MSGQFSDFYSNLDADPAKRGKQFEHFVLWFLKADPEWATQVDQVWLWDEWPQHWGVDCGIDLVFRHKNGEHWAVQAKCYSPDYDITKHDVDKFLSESNRPSIQHRLLISPPPTASERMPNRFAMRRRNPSSVFCCPILSVPRSTIPPTLPHSRKPSAKPVPNLATTSTKPETP